MPRKASQSDRNGGSAQASKTEEEVDLTTKMVSVDTKELEKFFLSDAYLDKLSDALGSRYQKSIKDITDPLFERIKALEDENKLLKANQKTEVDTKLDELEQHGRLNSLRIFNMPSDKVEDDCDKAVCDMLQKHLKVKVDPMDIDISHPLGEAKDNKVNVIVKFVQRSKRHEIFRKKKLLSTKKSGLVPNPTKISIGEDLTRVRQSMMKRLNTLYKDGKINSSWTQNGSVFVKVKETDHAKKLKIVFSDRELDRQLGL